jgi:hypothetical protein
MKSFSGTRASSTLLLDVGYNAVDGVLTVKEEMFPPYIVCFLTATPCIFMLSKSFIYQLMHNRVALREY